ncbi:GTP-binding protein Di-Ras1a isoform X1 [Dicentrarchus labrax]|uniref:Small monomeric GTPase n=2 Tax=Dicentrarchus labrax TaxID=13489 RepID=A0A8P4KD79_DICLA|nr:GTP-binding protein Di-Ras1a isoform X1 [Dicentrarchus labrax]
MMMMMMMMGGDGDDDVSQRAEGSGCSQPLQSRPIPDTETLRTRLRRHDSLKLTTDSDFEELQSSAALQSEQTGQPSRAAGRTPTPRMPEQSNDYRVVVFGAGGVGKSSLVLRFVKGTFRDTYIPTVEDTYRQVISCDKSVCTLQITDTTGSHQFPAMQRLSISKGHAFILVYSITSRQSLEELKPIYQQVLAIKGTVEAIPIMLVGNKSDETAQREVDTKEGEAQATAWKCAFMETSAKTNSNVKELFQELLALEKKRDMSLSIDGKRSGKQKRADKLKGKCSIM